MAGGKAPAFLDPVTYGKATRQLVFEKSVSQSWALYNRHIRRALGFRETSTSVKGRPKFASDHVTHLYDELDNLARNFPNHSLDKIKRAWKQQIYTEEVEHLLDQYGEKIWGDSLESREPTNPNSQLLTATDGSDAGDLFYQFERHRKL